jgi:MerR family transcriptional regulator, light-induced transcriptional regulator
LKKPKAAGATPLAADVHYRSGAVARMVRMPVATLRVWERRYGVAAPATTESGHRLYSAQQVQRLALLKQLTDLGHAIGAIAALDMQQLQQVAQTHARSLQNTRTPEKPPTAAALASGQRAQRSPGLTAVVVGAALAQRLARPGFVRAQAVALRVLAVLEQLPQTPQARLSPTPMPTRARADALLVQVPGLALAAVAAWVGPLRLLAERVGATQLVVICGHASLAVQQALSAHGVLLCQDTPQDTLLAQRLHDALGSSSQPASASAAVGAGPALPLPLPLPLPLRAPMRRYDDATLADLAGLSSTIACECPQHVASLLMQLSHFESYSAQCQAQGGSAQDMALHDYLWRVAGTARALFEDALERVAVQEGLMLAQSPASQASVARSPKRNGTPRKTPTRRAAKT